MTIRAPLLLPTARPLALAGVLVLAMSAANAARAPEIFSLSDPRGDDYGDGTLLYPQRDDLHKGDLDLLSLTARRVSDGTEFEAIFAKPITPPGRRTIDIGGGSLDTIARFGFYTFNIDIYVDTDGVPGSGNLRMLPGRRAEVARENAWEKVVVLTPRPFTARDRLKAILTRYTRKSLKEAEGRVDRKDLDAAKDRIAEDIEGRVYFPTQISIAGPKIRFFVPDSFFGGPAQTTWSYVVAVSGCDLEVRFDAGSALGIKEKGPDSLMIVPVAPGLSKDRFGGGREDDDLQPPLVDIVATPAHPQEEVLKDYDLRTNRPVRVPGVAPAAVPGR